MGFAERKMNQSSTGPVWLSRMGVVQAPPQLQPLSPSPTIPTNSLFSCGSRRMEGGTRVEGFRGYTHCRKSIHTYDNPGSNVPSSHCCCHGSGRVEAKCSLQPTTAEEQNPTSAPITAFYTGHSNLQNCSCISLYPEWFRAHPKDTCPYITFLMYM